MSRYHDQPHTLDPTKDDIPEDAPLAQGHDSERAEQVREADIRHTEEVQSEAESDEVGARAPGDDAAPKAKPAAKKGKDD